MANGDARSRTEKRDSMGEDDRLVLLEQDMDHIERKVDGLYGRLDTILSRQNYVLASLAGGAVLMALNLIVELGR